MDAVKKSNVVEYVHFIIALLLMFCFRFIPAPAPITPYGMAVMGVFVGAIYGWCFGGSNTLWASILALVALGLAMPTGAFGAVAAVMSNYVFIMVFLSLFTVGALIGANISEYLVYKLLSMEFLKGKSWLLICAVLIGDYLIGIATNPIVVTIFLFLLYGTMFEQAGYKPGERTPTMIVISTGMITLIASILYPWAAPQIIPLQILKGVGIVISNGAYMGLILCAGVVLIILCVFMMKLLNCDVEKLSNSDISFLKDKYENGMSRYQKAVLTGILIFALGSIIIAFFPKNLGVVSGIITGQLSFIGWMALAVGVMMFLKIEGKPLLEPKIMAASFPWDMLMMIGVGVTAGGMLTAEESGVTAWIGQQIGPVLAQTNDLTLCILLAVVGLILTNFLNNNAVIILLSTVVVSLFSQGIINDPIVPTIIVIISCEMVFLTPGASIYGALIHSHQYTTASSVYKYGCIMFMVTLLFCLAIVVPLTKLFF